MFIKNSFYLINFTGYSCLMYKLSFIVINNLKFFYNQLISYLKDLLCIHKTNLISIDLNMKKVLQVSVLLAIFIAR